MTRKCVSDLWFSPCACYCSIIVSALSGSAHAEVETELPATVILAERRGAYAANYSMWSTDEIRELSPRSVDGLLAHDPSFSLFRRQNALFSNPTSSGVSLGNTGASAASRSLVLRDGIPQNDPFGSWVSWTRYDVSTLSSARITSSAESAVWGNMSPAGSIQLTSREIDENRINLRTIVGSQGTFGGSTTIDQISENGELAASVHLFSFKSDGFYSLQKSQRGLVDRRLDLDYQGIDMRFKWQPRSGFTLESTFSFYDEERGNGTTLSRNDSRAFDISVRATHLNENGKIQYLGYYQRRDFSSVFASVAADRNSGRMALNQYDVPGEGYGGAIVRQREVHEDLDLTMGLDFRFLDGETNEDAGTFRRRRAGGRQSFVGLFGQSSWKLNDDTRLDTSLRLDHWSFTNGFRNERSLGTGAILRSDDYDDQSSIEPSVSISLRRELDEDTKIWLSAGSSFRAPSINELYRPFRVRSDVTEANATLDPERFFTLEAGVEWQHEESFDVSATIFHHWIQDAIANVPVTDPADITRVFGTLPAGGVGAQRQNIEEARVLGLRTSVEYTPDPRITLRFDGLWSHTEFNSSPDQRLIEGEAFPQSPDFRLTGSVIVRPTDDWSFFVGAEYASSVFDDLLGQRELPSYWTCRLGGSWQASESVRFNFRVENLFDEEIPTGLAGNGLRSVGQPRSIWFGAEYSF
ncbi:MAG: TonB-dependent receptor [Akkermansiaceae bacterium]